MKTSTLHALIAVLLLAPSAYASDFTFMRPCARANAMGGAFSTVGEDPCAVFYNPANLTTLTNLEVRLETARRLAGDAPEGEVSAVYIRPVPDTENKVAGLGYYSVRQRGGLGMDSMAFSTGNRSVIKYFQKPIFYGGGMKIIDLREAGKSHLGLGMDAGAQIENNMGFKTALVLSDVTLGLGRSLASITFGNSYRIKDTLLAVDLRARGSYSEVFFGVEHDIFNGLAQIRAGKGLALEGGQYLALGLGVNTLPWTIDLAWSLPWAGYHENVGYYGFNFGYRFGSQTFSEKLVGDASKEAESLKTQIDDLRGQKASLDSAIATGKVNKGMMESDLTLAQSRMRELEANLKELQVQILEAQYRKDNPKPAKKYVPPPPERWPKLHKAAAGETLRSIASKYYGNPALWEKIYDANESVISKGLPIEGAVLTIPAPAKEQ